MDMSVSVCVHVCACVGSSTINVKSLLQTSEFVLFCSVLLTGSLADPGVH